MIEPAYGISRADATSSTKTHRPEKVKRAHESGRPESFESDIRCGCALGIAPNCACKLQQHGRLFVLLRTVTQESSSTFYRGRLARGNLSS